MSKDTAYTEVFKRNNLCMRISRREYRGTTFVDVREFYSDLGDDAWKPSREGVTVKLRQLDEVIAGLKKLREMDDE